MRIMLLWPEGRREMGAMLAALEEAGHEVVYWVGEYPVEDLCPASAIFHDHYEAWDAKPASMLLHENIPPVSAGLIASMYETESLILSAMNKRYDRAPVDERKHVYYTMLAYWSFVLDKIRPDAIVYNDVPHSLYANVVYELGKHRGIRNIIFEGTMVAGRVLQYEDIWEGDVVLARLATQYASHPVRASDLSDDMRAYWGAQCAEEKPDAVPWYMAQQKRLAGGVELWRVRRRAAIAAIRKGTFLSLVGRFVERQFQKNLRTEYEHIARVPDLSRPFVYFPLNFQPERTTTPQGGIYADQILAVETVAAALPEGMSIYVKEHPSQWWLRSKTRFSSARYSGYYHRLARIPGVCVVPIHVPSREMIRRSFAVATVTGTAGWESVLMGKSPIVFGYPWYRDCPGVLRVAGTEDVACALEKIRNGFHVGGNDVLAFLRGIDEVGFPTNYALGTMCMEAVDEIKRYAWAIVSALAEPHVDRRHKSM